MFVYHVIKYNQSLSEGGIPDGYDDDTIHGDADNYGLFIYCPIYGLKPTATLLTKRRFLVALAIYEITHSIATIVFDIVEFSRISHGTTFLMIVKGGLISRHTFMVQFFMRLVVHLTAWGVMATCITIFIGFHYTRKFMVRHMQPLNRFETIRFNKLHAILHKSCGV